jgi:proline iminopeptidase
LVTVGCQRESRTVDGTGPTEGVVNAGGLDLPYIVRGRGTPLLAIGSASYGSRTFTGPILDYFKMYFVDLRHFVPADSGSEVETITIDTFAQDIDEVRQAFGFETVAVLGHSIHGNLALEYARRHPDRVTHVVVIGALPIGFMQGFFAAQDEQWESHASDERKAIRERNWAALTEDSLSKLSRADSVLATLVANVPLYWHNATFDWGPMWEGASPPNEDVFFRLNQLFFEYDLGQGPGQITAPVFVAMGLYDYIVPHTLWEDERQKLAHATFYLFEKSGHTPQLEEPELFAERAIEWFESTSSGASGSESPRSH